MSKDKTTKEAEAPSVSEFIELMVERNEKIVKDLSSGQLILARQQALLVKKFEEMQLEQAVIASVLVSILGVSMDSHDEAVKVYTDVKGKLRDDFITTEADDIENDLPELPENDNDKE